MILKAKKTVSKNFPEIGGKNPVLNDIVHLKAAMGWLCMAQDQTRCAGVSALYNLQKKSWGNPYRETTGYIIPTFINYGQMTGEKNFEKRAFEMEQWELNEQLPDGSFGEETKEGEIASYIPTNLISITDGQIYLSPKLFELGILPAVDVGKSVSRVGGKAQLPAYRSITGNLKLAYSQFEELETFSRFGTRLDENTRKIIEHGKRIRVCLKQNELHPMPVPEQIVILLALSGGLFDVVPVNKVQEAEAALQKIITELPKEVLNRLLSDNDLSDTDRKIILKIASDTLAPFKDKPEPESASETETKLKPKKEPEPEPDQNHK